MICELYHNKVVLQRRRHWRTEGVPVNISWQTEVEYSIVYADCCLKLHSTRQWGFFIFKCSGMTWRWKCIMLLYEMFVDSNNLKPGMGNEREGDSKGVFLEQCTQCVHFTQTFSLLNNAIVSLWENKSLRHSENSNTNEKECLDILCGM